MSAAAIYSEFNYDDLSLNDSTKTKWLVISENDFIDNYAESLGGAIWYTGLKSENINNSFVNNTAGFGFGSSTFSFPVKLKLDKQASNFISNSQSIDYIEAENSLIL